MEVVFLLAFLVVMSVIFLITETIKENKKLKEDKENEYLRLKENEPIKNKRIEELQNENNSLLKNITELTNINNSLMKHKGIMSVFEVLEENNDPRATKEKLAKLWDILPYYPPDWEIRKWIVRRREDYKCFCCGRNFYYSKDKDDYGEVHHIVPLSMNGTNEIKNLMFVCHNCHVKLHKELHNFNFSKFGYEPLYGWESYRIYPSLLRFKKSEREKLDILTRPPSYNEEEPDTDKYYNIPKWEEDL